MLLNMSFLRALLNVIDVEWLYPVPVSATRVGWAFDAEKVLENSAIGVCVADQFHHSLHNCHRSFWILVFSVIIYHLKHGLANIILVFEQECFVAVN